MVMEVEMTVVAVVAPEALVPVVKAKPVEVNIDELEGHVTALRKAKKDLKELEAYVKVLEDKITQTLEAKGATDGKINNAVAVTWRPISGYRFKEFRETYPQLADTYMEPTTVLELNKTRLLADHKALLEQFRSKSLLIK